MGTEHRFRLRHISPKGPAICVTAARLGHEFPDPRADGLSAATAMLESAALQRQHFAGDLTSLARYRSSDRQGSDDQVSGMCTFKLELLLTESICCEQL